MLTVNLTCKVDREFVANHPRTLKDHLDYGTEIEIDANGVPVIVRRLDKISLSANLTDLDLYVMHSPVTGLHRLNVACTDAERLQAHLLGFIDQQRRGV